MVVTEDGRHRRWSGARPAAMAILAADPRLFAGKTQNGPARAVWKQTGAGEGIRTLDPNLGKAKSNFATLRHRSLLPTETYILSDFWNVG